MPVDFNETFTGCEIGHSWNMAINPNSVLSGNCTESSFGVAEGVRNQFGSICFKPDDKLEYRPPANISFTAIDPGRRVRA